VGDREWVSIMERAAACLDAAPFGLAIIDPDDGRVAHANPAMASMCIDPASFAARVAVDPDRDTYAAVDGPGDLTVHVARFRAFRGPGAVVAVMATDFDNTFDPQDLEKTLNPPFEIHVAYDLDLVAVAVDPRHVEFGMDPADQIGSHGLLMAHPEDAVAVSPIARAVAAGEVEVASYTVRVAGPAGAWTNVTVTVRRFHGDRPGVLATNVPRDVVQETIDIARLTDRELDVVAGLLAGRRPAQVADDLDVSIHTVRHQMTALFGKLGVGGQADLIQRYRLPVR
jgi:DNA-binding CsgD family transcriptional regulator